MISGRWIGRNPAPIAWPPYSPDLSPLDFWLWGDMKHRIFAGDFQPKTESDLRMAVRRTVAEMNQDPAVRARVFNEFVNRLQLCIERGGQSVERR